jgi:hypothetical protein
MFNTIHHQNIHNIDKELSWLPNDTEELYLYNIENNYDQMSQNNWVGRQFTYKFNGYGFRSEEFSHDDNIMFFGCSHTAGIGLPYESTWAYNVAKTLDLKNFNLGMPGCGPDTAFRLANHYIPQVKPKIVVLLEPPPGRMALYSAKRRIYDFWATIQPDQYREPSFRSFYEHWLSLHENVVLHSLKHKLAIEMICNHLNIKFIYAHSDEISIIDHARDLGHAGEKSNMNFAKIILDRIAQTK